ncbi:uncharacterized protein [Antedon mediterranea]|uniref:uncharacterized protein n=1 Tax=Antedon mediterranea TaxID=105859 RepID=UPI003AF47598
MAADFDLDLVYVSTWYDEHDLLRQLKVLYQDLIAASKIDSATKTIHLLQELRANGRLSSDNRILLYDTIKVTEQFGVIDRLKHSFLEVQEITKFTRYRLQIVAFGNGLRQADVDRIDALYNGSALKNYKDAWSMILDFEQRKIICEEKIEEFINNLRQVGLGARVTPLTKGSELTFEIAARELDFQEAYNEALKEGKVKVNLGMLKVIGQEGVGKTCLINACLGKEFEKDHNITDGIAVIRTASTTWTEDTADSGNPLKLYTKVVADKLKAMERSTKNVVQEPADDYNIVNDNNSDGNLNNKDDDDTHNKDDDETETIPFDTEQQLDKKTLEEFEKNKEKTLEKTFNIWDHGGQLIYHGIHRIFMTLEALYIVVFDLSKDLDDPAIVIDSNGREYRHHWTNLQFILSYILSVYSHSRDLRKNMQKDVHQPTILIVGTHKGKLGETEEQQNVEAKKRFKKIRNVLKDKLYEAHVYHRYFAIENSQETTDESFSILKKVVDEFMSDLEKPIPLKWMRFRCELDDLRGKKHFSLCPFKELKLLAGKNGIAEDNQSILLNFLYDLGEIVYMPDNKLLKDKAVLDPMQLVEIVTAFVTVITPEIPAAINRDAFDKLDRGILEERLLRKLWSESKVDKGKNFEFLVALMIQLGFICKRKTTSSQDIKSKSKKSVVKRSFYVPLRLAFKTSTEVKPVPDEFPAISIYYDFEGYLPDVLFPYMIIDFLNKFQMEEVDPILLYNHAQLYFDQDHHVTLSLVKFITKEDNRKFLLKVTIKRTNTLAEKSNEEPSSEACKEVLSTVEMSFKQSKDGGRRGIPFKRCIPCDCSLTSKKKHFQFVKDFQRKSLTCSKDGIFIKMDVTRYHLLFGRGKEGPNKEQSKQEISEDDFLQLLTDTAEWFDGLGYLKILKVLYKDHLNINVEMERAGSVWDLLQYLRASGNLKPSNLTILYDTVKITQQCGFKSNVENQPPEDIKDHVVSTLSPFRQKVYQLGVKLRKNEVSKLARLFNSRPTVVVNEYQDSWSLIMDFEHRGIIDKDFTKMVTFLKVLERNGMKWAKKIFLDDEKDDTETLLQSVIRGSQQDIWLIVAVFCIALIAVLAVFVPFYDLIIIFLSTMGLFVTLVELVWCVHKKMTASGT